MKEQFRFAAEPSKVGREGRAPRQHGRWFRQGDGIVVLLDDQTQQPKEQELGDGRDDLTAAGSRAIRAAIEHGVRDENRLTDLVFHARHAERHGQRLQPQERQLIQEWLDIRGRLVRPTLRALSPVGAPVAPTHAKAAQPPSTTSGVEAAGNTTQIIQCILGLQDQGRRISFVQRYLRDLSRVEAMALKTMGLQIVSCYEEGTKLHNATQMAYFTRAQGQHDGNRAFTQAQAVGQPVGTPVYFAVDTDPNVSQRQAILDYFEGVADGYKHYLADMRAQNRPPITYSIGVYGSGCVLGWCQAQGIATWFWQAYAPAWCNNRDVWPGANIHTSGRDQPERCRWRLGHLEGWGNEGGW